MNPRLSGAAKEVISLPVSISAIMSIDFPKGFGVFYERGYVIKEYSLARKVRNASYMAFDFFK